MKELPGRPAVFVPVSRARGIKRKTASPSNTVVVVVVIEIDSEVVVPTAPGMDVVQPGVIVVVETVGRADLVQVEVASCKLMKEEQNVEAFRAIRTASQTPTLSRSSNSVGAGDAYSAVKRIVKENRCSRIIAEFAVCRHRS